MYNMHNILVIAAHPDDEILGVGATIKKLTEDGCVANAVILGEGLTSRSNCRSDTDKNLLEELKSHSKSATTTVGYSNVEFADLPDNRFDSLDLLDVIKIVQSYVDKYNPDTIFTHHYGDLNIDHKITFDSVITVCRPVNNCCVQNIFCFETPSSTEWNFKYGDSTFKPTVFFDVSLTLNYKLSAMKYYLTESTQYPHPRSTEALSVIAKRWGTVAGVDCAEAFEIVRSVVGVLSYRPATIEDMGLLYSWVNDSAVRKSAFNSSIISHEEHESWFARVLMDENVDIFIINYGNTPIGQLRLSYYGDCAEIDYSVDSRYRGRGFGKKIIKIIDSLPALKEHELRYLKARVKPDNVFSQRVFISNYYDEVQRDDVAVIFQKRLSTHKLSETESINIKATKRESLTSHKQQKRFETL